MTPWVIDTCVLLDLVCGTPAQVTAAEAALDAAPARTCCPVTLVELGPTFPDPVKLREFLLDYDVDSTEAFTSDDAELGRAAWQRIIAQRRATGSPRRPIADVLIGAFAARRAGLITRNGGDFTGFYPALPIWVPGQPMPTPIP